MPWGHAERSFWSCRGVSISGPYSLVEMGSVSFLRDFPLQFSNVIRSRVERVFASFFLVSVASLESRRRSYRYRFSKEATETRKTDAKNRSNLKRIKVKN